VVANLNTTPNAPETLLKWDSNALMGTFQDNLITHFVAAKTFFPHVADGGVYIGIGGGMADLLLQGVGYNSMYQSALRTMFRYIDFEAQNRQVAIRELVIGAMVSTETKLRPEASDYPWLADTDVGNHINQMIEDPSAFPGPVQLLTSPEGVGRSHPFDVPHR
jgi:hypothetical protein